MTLHAERGSQGLIAIGTIENIADSRHFKVDVRPQLRIKVAFARS